MSDTYIAMANLCLKLLPQLALGIATTAWLIGIGIRFLRNL